MGTKYILWKLDINFKDRYEPEQFSNVTGMIKRIAERNLREGEYIITGGELVLTLTEKK